ncbi:Rid family detoxifying hydrolase [Vibrio europaeus]|uniref:Rid family detoxifying hydrolase n=1 Tax=Vibrio europaeus TaxID=300876 RepID=UPI0023404770|nr:Rid family detoxifying hydrolase [Vibrio europaeus]MDC5848339.1 Rid family detoxifying hydrolase [Vibrio europaeus]
MKTIIQTELAPPAIGPYSQGMAFENLIFTSGQLPLEATTMALVEGGIKAQARMSLENLKTVLEQGGGSLDTVIKTTCFLSSMENFVAFNEVYTEIFGTENAPARSCVETSGLPKEALVEVEVEAIAYIE